ncbi:hypothetical protein CDAR_32971 [Caerostris darwini]|uniref:Uncharacterized protein n=1 Tax=Caerostris darwini TaxID=1538125 RepID=A0AAV4SIG9_9ARAC|nr:hypothetical protein CDAR_32971 [Caerostris darwini]
MHIGFCLFATVFQSDYYSKCSPDLLTWIPRPKTRESGNYARITRRVSTVQETSFDASYRSTSGRSLSSSAGLFFLAPCSIPPPSSLKLLPYPKTQGNRFYIIIDTSLLF